ncbi:response regulator [Corallococcus macrosporus]|uniref:Transcriptional regulator n=1 Tax=Corallococcus macrosporus DSM 14697 TaxID=1189310 RepID=A0A250JWG8_9BACT|nr:response regulator [Corallococcus macrosporus]ATB48063.1 transcriptional regulator [Corallococcus macrosporus DSM 14697]
MRVLLVEDDASLREGMGELISELAEVHAVSTGEDAVAALQAERFVLVITDLRISGGEQGGRTVVEAARQRQQPVAVVSAATPEEVTQAVLPHVADAILLKPFQIDDIVALVERFIALRQDVERLATQGGRPPASAWSSQGTHVRLAREPEPPTVWVSLTAGADVDWTFHPTSEGAGVQVVGGSLQVEGVTYAAPESLFLGAGQRPRVRSPEGCLAVVVGLKGQG